MIRQKTAKEKVMQWWAWKFFLYQLWKNSKNVFLGVPFNITLASKVTSTNNYEVTQTVGEGRGLLFADKQDGDGHTFFMISSGPPASHGKR